MDPDDPLTQCPYNPSHLILRSRMQGHIVKCKHNHPLDEKNVCPFNSIHRMDNPDFQYHIATCPDRHSVETHRYILESEHGDLSLTPYHQPDLPPTEEDWDAESPVTAYDPSQHLERAPVVRMLTGATKSQRKAFRLKERQRMQRLANGDEVPVPDEPQSGPSQVEDMAPLRLPHETSEALRLLDPSMGLGRGCVSHKTTERNPGDSSFEENLSLGFGRGSFTADEHTTFLPIGIGRGRPLVN